jgi:hypothetical protein
VECGVLTDFSLSQKGGQAKLSACNRPAPFSDRIVQKVKTHPGAKTMAVDSTTHTVFLPTAEFGAQR